MWANNMPLSVVAMNASVVAIDVLIALLLYNVLKASWINAFTSFAVNLGQSSLRKLRSKVWQTKLLATSPWSLPPTPSQTTKKEVLAVGSVGIRQSCWESRRPRWEKDSALFIRICMVLAVFPGFTKVF